MRGRTILILVLVLVVLVAAATIFETRRKRATHTSDTLVFGTLKTELVDRIRIKPPDEALVELIKQGDRWLVASEGNSPAEPRLVNDILERLPKFYADQVVSTNPEKQSLFQVDSTGTEVWIEQEGKEIGHFIVGKPGPDFLSSYVRPAGTNRVIQVAEYLPSLFQGHKTWREKTIFTLNTEEIRSYEYTSPTRGHLRISRDEDGGWQMEEPLQGPADGSTVNSMVGSFARLKAADFADTVSAAAAGIEADTTWIEATLADGSTHRMSIGLPAERNRNYARKVGAEQIVLIPRGGINSMMPPGDLLLRSSLPDVKVKTPGGE